MKHIKLFEAFGNDEEYMIDDPEDEYRDDSFYHDFDDEHDDYDQGYEIMMSKMIDHEGNVVDIGGWATEDGLFDYNYKFDYMAGVTVEDNTFVVGHMVTGTVDDETAGMCYNNKMVIYPIVHGEKYNNETKFDPYGYIPPAAVMYRPRRLER